MDKGNSFQGKRDRIIEAFYQCAVRDGLKKATNREIAKEAGLQLGLLHYYFKNREEMVVALVRRTADINIEKYRKAVEDVSSMEAKFQKAFEFLFVTMMDDSPGSLFYDLWSEAKRNPEVRKSFAQMYETYREQIVAQVMEMGLGAGLDSVQLKNMSSLLMAMNEGVLLQWDMDREGVDTATIARFAAEVFSVFFEHVSAISPEA